MLHAKYQPNWPSGSDVEVILMVFTIMGMATILNFES